MAALKEQGVDVSPNMVSIVKARLTVGKAKRRARGAGADAGGVAVQAKSKADSRFSSANRAAGLEAALTLHKAAASNQNASGGKIRQAFLSLVELLG